MCSDGQPSFFSQEKKMMENEDIPRLESGEDIKIDLNFDAPYTVRRRRYPFFVFFIILLLILLAFSVAGLYLNSKGVEAEAFAEQNEINEKIWTGAFCSEEIYNRCKESSVTVCVNGKRCSGFVFSSDGWIGTLEGIVNRDIEGKIEVKLYDGRVFFVNSFRQDQKSGLTLLKIDADGLSAVKFASGGNIIAGEELFSFFATDDGAKENSLFSGRVSLTDREVEIVSYDGRESTFKLLQIGILLTQEGAGAPLFNSNGELTAIACRNEMIDDSENHLINYAISAEEAYKAFEIMSRGERINFDTDLPFVIK